MEKKVRIIYLLNEEGRKKDILAGGGGKKIQFVETDITPEILDLARVSEEGNVELKLNCDLAIDVKITTDCGEPHLHYVKQTSASHYTDQCYYFDAPRTAETLIAWETARRERIATQKLELEPELKRLKTEYRANRAWHEAKDATCRRREEEAREIAAAKKAAWVAEKATWIAEYGSKHLIKAVYLGYDCQRQYVTERVALELPEFELDFDGRAEWRDCICPSETALDEVEDYLQRAWEAEIVWLTKTPRGDIEKPFKAREAIIIVNYLGEYTLLQKI